LKTRNSCSILAELLVISNVTLPAWTSAALSFMPWLLPFSPKSMYVKRQTDEPEHRHSGRPGRYPKRRVIAVLGTHMGYHGAVPKECDVGVPDYLKVLCCALVCGSPQCTAAPGTSLPFATARATAVLKSKAAVERTGPGLVQLTQRRL
jgi:hypothetical protein